MSRQHLKLPHDLNYMFPGVAIATIAKPKTRNVAAKKQHCLWDDSILILLLADWVVVYIPTSAIFFPTTSGEKSS